MGRILPTGTDATIERSDEPTVVYLDDSQCEELLGAVQSDTAREILRALNEEPMSQSDTAETLEMSVERVGYHIDKLQTAGLVEVLDTVYSEKGREMEVYGPSTDPVMLFFVLSSDQQMLRSAFADLVPAIGPVAILIVLKRLFSELSTPSDFPLSLPLS